MKKFNYFVLVILSFVLISCDKESKSVKPTTERINGKLGDYFEVVSRDYAFNEGRVAVEFKRVKDGLPLPWNSNIALGYSDGCYEPQFMVEFMDQDADVVSKDISDIVTDRNELESLMSLNENETSTLTLTVGATNAVGFRVSSDFVLHNVNPYLMNFFGHIGQSLEANMSLTLFPDGNIVGAYYHKQFGPDALLYLLGEQNGDDGIVLKEFSGSGNLIGKFDGNFTKGAFKGVYESFDGNKYDFLMENDAEMAPIYLGNIDFGRFGAMNGMEEYENFYKEMFEDAGIIPFASDTMTVMLNKQELQLKVGEMDTLVVVTSLLDGMKTSWSSSDEAVAMIGASGVVRAIGEGEAVLTCNIEPLKGNALTATATVKVEKAKAQSQSKPKNNNLNLGFATYEPLPQSGISGVKNGQPHGNGIMRFKERHIIPGTQDCMAEPGEWVNGMWRDGKINAGTWYRNDGNQVIVKLGQRYNK
ncbi:MAG: hypothetical protein K6G25_12985 [Bacteroidales bacterium]|nr:hypothetical protein [Bacteroidales bacterium]